MKMWNCIGMCVGMIVPLAADPVCKRCEQIREENKGKVNPYVYYEDYLKDHPEALENKNTPPEATEETPSNKE